MGCCGCNLNVSTRTAGIMGILLSVYGLGFSVYLTLVLFDPMWNINQTTGPTAVVPTGPPVVVTTGPQSNPTNAKLSSNQIEKFWFDYYTANNSNVFKGLAATAVILNTVWLFVSALLIVANVKRFVPGLWVWVGTTIVIIVAEVSFTITSVALVGRELVNRIKDSHLKSLPFSNQEYLAVTILIIAFNRLGIVGFIVNICLAVFVGRRANEIGVQNRKNVFRKDINSPLPFNGQPIYPGATQPVGEPAYDMSYLNNGYAPESSAPPISHLDSDTDEENDNDIPALSNDNFQFKPSSRIQPQPGRGPEWGSDHYDDLSPTKVLPAFPSRTPSLQDRLKPPIYRQTAFHGSPSDSPVQGRSPALGNRDQPNSRLGQPVHNDPIPDYNSPPDNNKPKAPVDSNRGPYDDDVPRRRMENPARVPINPGKPNRNPLYQDDAPEPTNRRPPYIEMPPPRSGNPQLPKVPPQSVNQGGIVRNPLYQSESETPTDLNPPPGYFDGFPKDRRSFREYDGKPKRPKEGSNRGQPTSAQPTRDHSPPRQRNQNLRGNPTSGPNMDRGEINIPRARRDFDDPRAADDGLPPQERPFGGHGNAGIPRARRDVEEPRQNQKYNNPVDPEIHRDRTRNNDDSQRGRRPPQEVYPEVRRDRPRDNEDSYRGRRPPQEVFPEVRRDRPRDNEDRGRRPPQEVYPEVRRDRPTKDNEDSYRGRRPPQEVYPRGDVDVRRANPDDRVRNLGQPYPSVGRRDFGGPAPRDRDPQSVDVSRNFSFTRPSNGQGIVRGLPRQ